MNIRSYVMFAREIDFERLRQKCEEKLNVVEERRRCFEREAAERAEREPETSGTASVNRRRVSHRKNCFEMPIRRSAKSRKNVAKARKYQFEEMVKRNIGLGVHRLD